MTCEIARIVERVLCLQLSAYLLERNFQLEENHGFTKGRGCNTAVLEIVQELQEAVEEGEVPVLLGVDISSAFDCMDRDKLLQQLKRMCFGPGSMQLLKSYFEDRTQQVEVGGRRAKKRDSKIGVLQGAGLSPPFFMIYFMRGVNSLRSCERCLKELEKNPRERGERCEKCGKAVAYADDCSGLIRSKGDLKDIKNKVEMQGAKIDDTLRRLGLSMNKSKTQFTIVMNYQRR